jgi:glycosyltransferase involved in cell wall biosynthesis
VFNSNNLDCSVGNTENLVLSYLNEHQDLNIQYLRQEKNKGKEAAMHTGIVHATGDYLLIQYADLEY